MKHLSLKQLPIKQLVRAAVIAAVYAAITIFTQPIAYGPVQFRVSEVLTVLPFILPESVWGLTLGCLIANIYGGSVIDMIFGTLATLLAALATTKIKRFFLVPVPTVLFNGVIVGAVVTLISTEFTLVNYLTIAASIALSETIICYAGGLPFLFAWQKLSKRLSFLR